MTTENAAVVGFLILMVSSLLVGVWVLQPLDRAARRRRGKVQFTIIDFLGLMFLLQLPMALIKFAVEAIPAKRDSGGVEFLLYGLSWVFTGLVWYTCVTVFSRAGVTSARDRGWTVFLVLPMAYLGTFAAPGLTLVALTIDMPTFQRSGLIAIAVLLGAGLISSGVVSRRVVRRARPT